MKSVLLNAHARYSFGCERETRVSHGDKRGGNCQHKKRNPIICHLPKYCRGVCAFFFLFSFAVFRITINNGNSVGKIAANQIIVSNFRCN